MPKKDESYENGRTRQLEFTAHLIESEQRAAIEQVNLFADFDLRATRDHMMRWLALDDLRLDLNA